MKRFRKFLNEWVEEKNLEKELDQVDKLVDNNPEIQKILDDLEKEEAKELGESLVSEGNGSPFGDVGGTFYNGGTDEIVGNENDSSNDNELSGDQIIKEKDQEGEKTYTDTFLFLKKMKNNPPSFDEIKNNFQKFKIVDGKLQLRRDKFFGDFQVMTDQELNDYLQELNDKQTVKKTIYKIDKNTGVMSTEKIVADPDSPEGVKIVKPETVIKGPKTMESLCKLLNILFQKEMPDRLFWWENKGGTKEKVLTITDGEVKRNKNNDELHDFKDVKYIPLIDTKLQNRVCLYLIEAKNRKKTKEKVTIGFKNGKFTKNGVELSDKENEKFLRARNGMDNESSDYWDHFHFLEEGSKIGATTGSFSLPPGTTCLDGVPCAHEGCYAYKSFRNPAARACWFSNLALLQEGKNSKGVDRYKQFVDECVKFIKKHSLTHFRFHVSGDIDIGTNKDKYVAAICEIAKACSNVYFWTYTKDYAAWDGVSVPGNLVVILSAWGEFRPNENLSNKHPVAFLYDEKDKDIMDRLERDGIIPKLQHYDEEKLSAEEEAKRKKAREKAAKKYAKKEHSSDDPVVFCPCSDPAIKETVTCDKCKLCFSRSAHHNVAFHKH